MFIKTELWAVVLLVAVAVWAPRAHARLVEIKAPVSDYFPPHVVEEINRGLEQLSEKLDPDVCGGLATVEEDLTVWERDRGPPSAASPMTYKQEFAWGCQFDPKDGVNVRMYSDSFQQPGEKLEAEYAIEAQITWYYDRGKDARLEGTIRDDDGSPLKGARVRVEGLGRGYRAVWDTNAQGFYSLGLPSDEYSIVVQREGCTQKTLVTPVCAFGAADEDRGLPEGVSQRPMGQRYVTVVDFTLPCRDYYIQDTDERVVSMPIAMVQQIRKETFVFTGQPKQPAQSGKLGWQTLWEVEGNLNAEVRIQGNPTQLAPGGFVRCTPPLQECTGRDRDTLRLTFDASAVTGVGDRIAITSVRSGVYHQEALQCNIVTCYPPFGPPVTLPSTGPPMTETQSPTFTHEGEIVAFRGAEGATIAMKVEGYEQPYLLQIRRGRPGVE